MKKHMTEFLYITLNQIFVEILMTIDRKTTNISEVSDFHESTEGCDVLSKGIN